MPLNPFLVFAASGKPRCALRRMASSTVGILARWVGQIPSYPWDWLKYLLGAKSAGNGRKWWNSSQLRLEGGGII
jgi:hypothetical protein